MAPEQRDVKTRKDAHEAPFTFTLASNKALGPNTRPTNCFSCFCTHLKFWIKVLIRRAGGFNRRLPTIVFNHAQKCAQSSSTWRRPWTICGSALLSSAERAINHLSSSKKNHPAESCGEIINRCMPDDHIACKIIEIRAQGSGTGSGGSVSCEVDTPSAVLADFGSKNLGVIVEETSRDLGAVPDQACETKLPSAFDVLMGMPRSYTHLPKPRFVSSVNVYTSTHQAYR